MDPSGKSGSETVKSLGIAGVLLIALGLVFATGTVDLTQAQTVVYGYVFQGINYNITTLTEADSGVVFEGVIEGVVDVNVNVTAIFPTGTTGSVSVWVATEALSPGQITALGYPDPATAFTGRETAFLITDIRINRTITAGSPPTVEINMTVPSPDATAYFWNDTIMDWQPFPNQTVVPVGGTFVLRMQIGVELMGTPFVITIPAPPPAVGGILDLETATGKAGAAMIAIGVALLVASLVAYKRLGRERASLAATTPSPGGAEY